MHCRRAAPVVRPAANSFPPACAKLSLLFRTGSRRRAGGCNVGSRVRSRGRLSMIVSRAGRLVLLTAGLVALGCTKSVGDSPSAAASGSASSAAAPVAAPSASAHKARGMFRHHGGLAGSLLFAAHDLDLKEQQKASVDS